jgi:hypothetical protein
MGKRAFACSLSGLYIRWRLNGAIGRIYLSVRVFYLPIHNIKVDQKLYFSIREYLT